MNNLSHIGCLPKEQGGCGLGTVFTASPDNCPENLGNVYVTVGHPLVEDRPPPPHQEGDGWKVAMADLGRKEPYAQLQTVPSLSISSSEEESDGGGVADTGGRGRGQAGAQVRESPRALPAPKLCNSAFLSTGAYVYVRGAVKRSTQVRGWSGQPQRLQKW